jgi:hypothetical protein
MRPLAPPFFLFCPEKPGSLGQVRVLRLSLEVLYLKSQIPSTKFQINIKFQIPNQFKAIVFLFGILNFGHCYLFVFWDLLFGISICQ